MLGKLNRLKLYITSHLKGVGSLTKKYSLFKHNLDGNAYVVCTTGQLTSVFILLFVPQSFPVMVGDMDNTGSLNAQVIHQLTTAVRSKIAIQVCRLVEDLSDVLFRHVTVISEFLLYSVSVFQTQQHKFVNWQCDMEYRGKDFTTAVTLGNPDMLVGSGMFNLTKWKICGTRC